MPKKTIEVKAVRHHDWGGRLHLKGDIYTTELNQGLELARLGFVDVIDAKHMANFVKEMDRDAIKRTLDRMSVEYHPTTNTAGLRKKLKQALSEEV